MNSPVVETFGDLAADLVAAFGEGVGASWPEARFETLALRVFAHQFAVNPVYRRYCEARGATPVTVDRWSAIPPVPARGFKHLELSPGPDEAVFETSGTTEGGGRRGRHGVRSLELYRAACLPGLRAHLAPDRERIRVLSLVPTAAAAPASSLSRMMAFAVDEIGASGSATFADPQAGVDLEGFGRAVARAVDEGEPVWVAGTAFAFVHWIDAVAEGRGAAVSLPAGSRVMETGGFKGRSREVGKAELYAGITATLGVPGSWIVNEYGMTELLSQFYDGVAGDPTRPPPAERVHRPPPWMRSLALDPETLSPAPPGRPGVLAHVDLANAGSVAAVLTEDVGVLREGGGFALLGRSPGSEPRGCSLALDDLLRVGPHGGASP